MGTGVGSSGSYGAIGFHNQNSYHRPT